MSEEIMAGDRPYRPAPLSPRRKNAAFRDVGSSGAEIAGGFVDGDEHASYAVSGHTPDMDIPGLRVFIRDGMDFTTAARMLRAMAARVEKLA